MSFVLLSYTLPNHVSLELLQSKTDEYGSTIWCLLYFKRRYKLMGDNVHLSVSTPMTTYYPHSMM